MLCCFAHKDRSKAVPSLSLPCNVVYVHVSFGCIEFCYSIMCLLRIVVYTYALYCIHLHFGSVSLGALLCVAGSL